MLSRRSFLKGFLGLAAAPVVGVVVAAVPSIALPKLLAGEIGFIDGGVRFVEPSITVDDILKAKAMLNKNGCRPMSDGNFIAWCHSDVYDDLMALGPIEGVRLSSNQNYLNMRGRW